MGDTLNSTFELQTERGELFWWPLLFEALSWHGFHFTAPGKPAGVGYYFYRSYVQEEDSDFVCSSFRELWERIVDRQAQVMVSLWSSCADPFPLDLLIASKGDAATLSVSLGCDDAYLGSDEIDPETVKERLRLLWECSKTLFVVCQPCRGELSWGEAAPGTPALASFGQPLEVSEEARHWWRLQVQEQVLPGGERIFVAQPWYVRRRQGELAYWPLED
ncbi:hypothetical protein [Thermogemmatispora carboxidivorans]|uniref:hypothetical protein n=1 Tax=Thermogemmatispora carboxidivorans TaxID=1382306 RepID=UPI00069C2CD4|nr:hypothetical protein [Thermogemmatispora carboxidivorans]